MFFFLGSLNAVKTGEVSRVREGIEPKTVLELRDRKPDKANQDPADDNERLL